MTGPQMTRLPSPVDLSAVIAKAVRAFGQTPGGLVLIGGAALQAYGITRATKDVDFAVTRAGAAEVEQRARAQQLPVSPLRIGGVSVSFGDVSAAFIDRRVEVEPLFIEAIAAAQRLGFALTADDINVLVMPLEYLVALKMVGVRPQDEADVAHLLRLAQLDYGAARQIVQKHLGGVAARYLDKAARLAQRQDAPALYETDGGV